MIITRIKVFETNSSSTHVLSISGDCDLYDTLPVNEKGIVILEANSYPLADNENFKYGSAQEKAQIIFASIGADKFPSWKLDKCGKEKLDMFEKVILEHTQAHSILYRFGGNQYCGFESWAGDIDSDTFTETNLKNLIFNPKSFIWFGDDTDDIDRCSFDD